MIVTSVSLPITNVNHNSLDHNSNIDILINDITDRNNRNDFKVLPCNIEVNKDIETVFKNSVQVFMWHTY